MRRLLITAVALMLAGPAQADEVHVIQLTLKDHRFTPAAIEAPPGKRIRIELVNQDLALEEFDSLDLGVEKDVTPRGRVAFFVGPLSPGVYSFMGEFHPDTASGVLRVQEAPSSGSN